MDDQVKIRGYRIELGEIEARIRDQAGIKNAAVIVAGKTPLDQKLVAFVQPGPGEQLAAESLRASLADVLPGYMIPQIIVEIHELPRTSSGKVDKKMLATLPMKEKAEETLFLDAALSKLLTEQAEIREAVVVINKRTQERTCHYQVAEDAYVTVGALRKLTRQAITDDMPLRQFIEVQDWPRHTDGGIDWKALHEEDKSADQPRTETEKALHRIWVDVIGNDAIRRTDNFFDVGGHSLLAVQVIMRIRKELGAEISQDRLLLGNLETLATECDAQRQPGAAENAVEAPAEVASSSGVAEKSEPQPATEPTAEKASKGLFSKLFRR
jgi:acyl carrier protein